MSSRTTWNPAAVSCMSSRIVSPGFMNVSFDGSGVVAANGLRKTVGGSGDACGTPFVVMNAKLTGSTPAWVRHCWFCVVPSTCETERLSMVSAAHHCVGLQLTPGSHEVHPGGPTRRPSQRPRHGSAGRLGHTQCLCCPSPCDRTPVLVAVSRCLTETRKRLDRYRSACRLYRYRTKLGRSAAMEPSHIIAGIVATR